MAKERGRQQGRHDVEFSMSRCVGQRAHCWPLEVVAGSGGGGRWGGRRNNVRWGGVAIRAQREDVAVVGRLTCSSNLEGKTFELHE
jgi:hypothetical protein